MQIKIPEGFPNQRLIIIPQSVLSKYAELPICKQLHVTHIGNFPHAPHHYINREDGTDNAILIYCVSGNGFLKLDQTTRAIEPGQAIFIHPKQPHSYWVDENTPWSIFWIHINGTLLHEIAANLGFTKEKPIIYYPNIEQMKELFENVYNCLNDHFTDAGLMSMSSELIRLFSFLKKKHRSNQITQTNTKNQILRTIKFMEDHYDQQISLEDFAKQSGLSVPHYSKLFKDLTQQAPINYFIQIKINKACELLIQTTKSVKTIATQLGYEDPYYFSRLFKKTQGHSPAQFRKMAKS